MFPAAVVETGPCHGASGSSWAAMAAFQMAVQLQTTWEMLPEGKRVRSGP